MFSIYNILTDVVTECSRTSSSGDNGEGAEKVQMQGERVNANVRQVPTILT